MPLNAEAISSGIEEGMGLLKKIGSSGIGQMGKDVMKSKSGKAAILGGLFLAGLSKEVVRPTIKAGLDVAFDDPNADQKVLGTDLTPSMLIGANIGGPIGGLARGANAYRFGVGGTNPYYAQQNTGRAGGIIGAVGGGIYGYKKGFGGIKGTKGAVIGAIGGGIAGNVAGRVTGAGGSLMFAQKYARTNAQILNESPFYNKSLMTADRMNASGNIVLGAHNTRKGQY
jgi:hypothetical protein